MRHLFRLWPIVLLVALAVGMAACGGGKASKPKPSVRTVSGTWEADGDDWRVLKVPVGGAYVTCVKFEDGMPSAGGLSCDWRGFNHRTAR